MILHLCALTPIILGYSSNAMNVNGVNIQGQLVSGENIQTINNQSILTSGNLTAKVGHYFPLTPSVSSQITNVVCNYSSLSQGAQAVNRITLSPFIFQNAVTISAISFVVNTPQVSQNMRVLVYNNNINVPSGKLLESPNIGVDTSGVKTYSVNYTFNAGQVYWIGIQASGNSVTLRTASVGLCIPLQQVSLTNTNVNTSTTTQNYAFGSAPSVINIGDLSFITSSVLMYLTIS